MNHFSASFKRRNVASWAHLLLSPKDTNKTEVTSGLIKGRDGGIDLGGISSL